MHGSDRDYKQIMTALRSYYSDPFNNAQRLLSHYKAAGRIPQLDIQPKEAARVIKEHLEVIQYTKWSLEKVQHKNAETHIYTEHYGRTLTNLIPFS